MLCMPNVVQVQGDRHEQTQGISLSRGRQRRESTSRQTVRPRNDSLTLIPAVTQLLTICWYALHGHHPDDIAERRARAPWYLSKTNPSFADMLAKLRRIIIADQYSPGRLRAPYQQKTTAIQRAWDTMLDKRPKSSMTARRLFTARSGTIGTCARQIDPEFHDPGVGGPDGRGPSRLSNRMTAWLLARQIAMN